MCICAAALTVAFADSSHADVEDFYGTYRAGSRLCWGTPLVLTVKTVTVEDCRRVSYRVLEQKGKDLTIELINRPKKCVIPAVRFGGLTEHGGIALYIFESLDDIPINRYVSYCTYGKIQPDDPYRR